MTDLEKKIENLASKHKLNVDCVHGHNPTIFVLQDYKKISDFILALKNDQGLKFSVLIDVFAVDFPDREKRFEIVYNLLSLKLNSRLVVKIHISEKDHVPTLTKVHRGANWYEREVYDMFGVVFDKHPDMRRILTDYGFVGHPLRKDFPVYGYTEIRYDESQQRIIHEPVNLHQEFREFNFQSPWEGPGKYVLPGDEKASK